MRYTFNQFGFRLHRINELTQQMNAAGSDKGLGLTGCHGYTRVYQKLFARHRDSDVTFVEIGLLRTDRDKRRNHNGEEDATPLKATGAPSLRVWRNFLPRARLVGFDIDDFSTVSIAGATILQGDMSKREDLLRIAHACEGKIDILIDDGSHASHHQQLAFATLFPFISEGGLYIIEDCHWQDPKFETRNYPQTRHVFQAWRLHKRVRSPCVTREQEEALGASIEKVEFFDSLDEGSGDVEDALCVIHKKGR